MLLRIAGADCSAFTNMIELTPTGKWLAEQDRMFSDGLGIKVVG
jgi:hypothetical protein